MLLYFDYAASTPIDRRVLRAMLPYFSEKFGNPGSLHSFGQEAIAAVDESRETIAKIVGADFREIIFTSSATEANNLALRGIVKRQATSDKRQGAWSMRPQIIISSIEHESVLETARDLEKDGVEVIYLPVDKNGVVDLKKLREFLNERTALVSIMYANNEIGAVQPIREVAKIIRDFRESHRSSVASHQFPLFHTDAAQAFQFLDCDVKNLGVDLMTLSAHKIYGPKGVGLLYRRISNPQFPISKQGTNLKIAKLKIENLQSVSPIVTGGEQEFGLRSGTENVPAIVGFAKAVELLFSNSQEFENKRIAGLRDYFWHRLKDVCPKAEINGQPLSTNYESDTNMPIRKFVKNSLFVYKLPNILNVYFPGYKAGDLLTKFDLAGLAVSAGSACRSRAVDGSYVIEAVIEALGRDKERVNSSIRFSFGRPTTKKEIEGALEIVKNCL